MKLSCPNCQSKDTKKKRTWVFWILFIVFFPLSILFFLIPPYKICTPCGFAWK